MPHWRMFHQRDDYAFMGLKISRGKASSISVMKRVQAMRQIGSFRHLVAFYTILLVSCISPPSWAGDLRHGKIIAQRWCAACHVVVPEQSGAWADAPSFSDIARRRVDKDALARFLMDPHPPMPDMQLSRREIDDIVSYIRSLDPRPAPKSDPEESDAPTPRRG